MHHAEYKQILSASSQSCSVVYLSLSLMLAVFQLHIYWKSMRCAQALLQTQRLSHRWNYSLYPLSQFDDSLLVRSDSRREQAPLFWEMWQCVENMLCWFFVFFVCVFSLIKVEENVTAAAELKQKTSSEMSTRHFLTKHWWGILRLWVDIFRCTRGSLGSPVTSDKQVGNLVFLRHKKNHVNPQRAWRLQAQNSLSTSFSNQDISSVTHTRSFLASIPLFLL